VLADLYDNPNRPEDAIADVAGRLGAIVGALDAITQRLFFFFFFFFHSTQTQQKNPRMLNC
jgi:hypothetical protein